MIKKLLLIAKKYFIMYLYNGNGAKPKTKYDRVQVICYEKSKIHICKNSAYIADISYDDRGSCPVVCLKGHLRE